MTGSNFLVLLNAFVRQTERGAEAERVVMASFLLHLCVTWDSDDLYFVRVKALIIVTNNIWWFCKSLSFSFSIFSIQDTLLDSYILPYSSPIHLRSSVSLFDAVTNVWAFIVFQRLIVVLLQHYGTSRNMVNIQHSPTKWSSGVTTGTIFVVLALGSVRRMEPGAARRLSA